MAAIGIVIIGAAADFGGWPVGIARKILVPVACRTLIVMNIMLGLEL